MLPYLELQIREDYTVDWIGFREKTEGKDLPEKKLNVSGVHIEYNMVGYSDSILDSKVFLLILHNQLTAS